MNRIILNETSYFGAGCRSVIAVEAARRGFKKAFFVTDWLPHLSEGTSRNES